MTSPTLPPDVFDALPPAVRAYIRSRTARVAELEARLDLNSSKPPSSDGPHVEPAPPETPSGEQSGDILHSAGTIPTPTGNDCRITSTEAGRIVTGSEHLPAGPMPPAGWPERLFHGFLEAAPDAVVIVDRGGMIVQVNGRAEGLFGYPRAELLGRPLEVLMPERFRGSHVAHRQGYSDDMHPRPMGRGLDLIGLRKDGREFPIDISLSPLPSDAGVLMVSAIRDMTDHRRLEDELRARTQELEEADRQKDQLLSAVAHELRNPLSALAYVAQILNDPQAAAAAHQRASGVIERQTAHMSRLVEDLLDAERIRCGKLTLRRESIDLRTFVPRAVEFSHLLIEAREHHLEVVPCTDPLWVSGDPTRLAQVVSNLLTNAAKYTPNGGHIRLTAAREEWAAVVRVRDDGAGIPQEMLSRVFDLFTQIGAAGDAQAGGLGIGLALVRRLVELHGGTVAAYSDGPGRGSEFVVRLPLLPDGPGADEPNAAPGGRPKR
jgi:PAS domain S-box-containing protein